MLHLQVEGILDRAHVVALRDVIAAADAAGTAGFILHCTGMTGADAAGLGLLRELRDRGAQFLDLPVPVAWNLGLMDIPSSDTNEHSRIMQ